MRNPQSAVLVAIPNILSLVRLIAGPIYLILGDFPASPVVIILLSLVAVTDLFDGWIARVLKATSRLGAFIDTAADKVYALALFIKLWSVNVVSSWLLSVIILQYLLLPLVALLYVRVLDAVPKPSIPARIGALLATITVLVGLTGRLKNTVILFALLTIAANCLHLGGRFVEVARANLVKRDASID